MEFLLVVPQLGLGLAGRGQVGQGVLGVRVGAGRRGRGGHPVVETGAGLRELGWRGRTRDNGAKKKEGRKAGRDGQTDKGEKDKSQTELLAKPAQQ